MCCSFCQLIEIFTLILKLFWCILWGQIFVLLKACELIGSNPRFCLLFLSLTRNKIAGRCSPLSLKELKILNLSKNLISSLPENFLEACPKVESFSARMNFLGEHFVSRLFYTGLLSLLWWDGQWNRVTWAHRGWALEENISTWNWSFQNSYLCWQHKMSHPTGNRHSQC